MADKVVVGVYKTETEVISAIRRLKEMGYDKKDISVLARDPERFGRIEAATDIATETPKSAAGGAGAGAVTGGLLGGVGALLIELGVLVIPGVGPFLAAGPITATLGGIIAGGAVGGIIGALVGLGVDKGDAEHYEASLKNGDLLVLANVSEDRYDRVKDIFLYPEEEYYKHYKGGSDDLMGMDLDGRVIAPNPPDINR